MGEWVVSMPQLIFMIAASFLAGFVDAVAGGGGLISVPAYIMTGMPMHLVYGCNKFAAACGTSIATLRYWRHKMVEIPVGLSAAAGSFCCSVISSQLVLILDDKTLKTMMMIILPVVGMITLLNRDMGNTDRSGDFSPRRRMVLGFFIGCMMGFYDGLFGPGTGTFSLISFCLIMHYDMRMGTGNAKFLNLASNYATLAVFTLAGTIYWKVALPVAAASIAGGFFGSGSTAVLCNKERLQIYPAYADGRNRPAVYQADYGRFALRTYPLIRYVQMTQSDFSAGRELFAGVPRGTAGKSGKDCRK